MCELCDEAEDHIVSCQDCGRTICFDTTPSNVDVVDQAYVTSSGDLFCRRCGMQYDIDEDEGYDEYGDDYYPYPDEQVAIPIEWDDESEAA